MDNLEKTVLYTNLKEYMIRTSIVFGLCEEKEIDTDEAYKKLIDIWNEYSEATIKIFESDNHER
jgi:hypothetical protein|tara:strand:+ start:272 stop:463 length:192 start_codon:yes stop_codon:yes gene_type:complete